MFDHCCGHATIVASRQPSWRLMYTARLWRYRRSTRASFGPNRSVTPNMQPLDAPTLMFAGVAFTCDTCRKDVRGPPAIPPSAWPAAPARSCGPNISGTEIIRVGNHPAMFARPGTFCASFRHAKRRHASSDTTPDLHHIRNETTPYGIFAADLIAAEMRERAAAKSKLMPSTSQ